MKTFKNKNFSILRMLKIAKVRVVTIVISNININMLVKVAWN